MSSQPFIAAEHQASTLHLPPGRWLTVLDCLSEHFSAISREQWLDRIARGRVLDADGAPISPQLAYREGLRIHYFREVPNETPIPVQETILYADEHLVVADKPHFMPVTPSGRYLQNTLLVRLKRRLGLPELSPLHRIDRETAGLVMLSVQQRTRGVYQALFRDRQITKHYDAIAHWRADVVFPRDHVSRLEESPQFFRMHEVPGEPNSHTHMQVLEVAGDWARYRLSPITGKRHQLRVHMAALGLPLRNDPFYPVVNDPAEGDYSRPLQLLARSLEFVDPVTGQQKAFESRQTLVLA